jgi:hypothetical protein
MAAFVSRRNGRHFRILNDANVIGSRFRADSTGFGGSGQRLTFH